MTPRKRKATGSAENSPSFDRRLSRLHRVLGTPTVDPVIARTGPTPETARRLKNRITRKIDRLLVRAHKLSDDLVEEREIAVQKSSGTSTVALFALLLLLLCMLFSNLQCFISQSFAVSKAR